MAPKGVHSGLPRVSVVAWSCRDIANTLSPGHPPESSRSTGIQTRHGISTTKDAIVMMKGASMAQSANNNQRRTHNALVDAGDGCGTCWRHESRSKCQASNENGGDADSDWPGCLASGKSDDSATRAANCA